jgi:hypothetical protein
MKLDEVIVRPSSSPVSPPPSPNSCAPLPHTPLRRRPLPSRFHYRRSVASANAGPMGRARGATAEGPSLGIQTPRSYGLLGISKLLRRQKRGRELARRPKKTTLAFLSQFSFPTALGQTGREDRGGEKPHRGRTL